MRHQATLTMSVMIAITFTFSYLPELLVPGRPDVAGQKPRIAILATGITADGVEEAIEAAPEIKDLADLRGEQVGIIGSQDVNDRVWLQLAARINDVLATGDMHGIVVTQGTDTMEETAYFLNLVVKSDKPVVIVGSMANLSSAVAAAGDPRATGRGVLVMLNEQIHAAGSNRGPVALVYPTRIAWLPSPDKKHTTRSELSVKGVRALPRVDIIYAHANMSVDLITAAMECGARGLVIAGAGDGSMSQAALETLSKAAKSGIVVVRSSRLERGLVLRNREANDDAMGFVASGELNAPKSRVLLQLALLQTKDRARIQTMFDEY